MTTCRVGIIGAGVHGASAAFHLSHSLDDIVVFDARYPAGGPTGLSSAICRAYYTNDFLAEMARESIEMLSRFTDEVGTDAGFHRTGFLFLHPADDVEHLSERCARLNEIGTVVDLLDREMLARRFPMVESTGIAAGVWERDAGYADPAGTTTAMLGAASARGVQVRTNSRIMMVEPRGGGGADVVTSAGDRIRCDKLLIAAGPWTRPLARMAGVDLPLTVERHIVATAAWGSAPPMSFGHGDLQSGYYFRPEGKETFLLGWLSAAEEVDPDDFSTTTTDGEINGLFEAVLGRIPNLKGAEGRGGWASLYDVSPDWQPVIGEIAPGIFVDAGTSGHGFKLAPALGRQVAQMVMGSPDPGLEQFSPHRFAESRLLDSGYRGMKILG